MEVRDSTVRHATGFLDPRHVRTCRVPERPADLVCRIAIFGPMGAGKTTLAARLASLRGLACDTLDSVYWSADWTPTPKADYITHVSRLAQRPTWVIDTASTGAALETLWERATVIVWLDLPRSLCVRRVLFRSLRRVARRELLWAGNRETVGRLFSSESAPYAAWHHHSTVRDVLGARASDRRVVRLLDRRAIDGFVLSMADQWNSLGPGHIETKV